VDADTLEVALRHAAELYSNRKVWACMQRNGMATDVSWRRPAHHHPALYRDLLAARAMDRTVLTA
jgi:starch synthase